MIKKFLNRYQSDDAPAYGIPRYGAGQTPVLRDVSAKRTISSVHSRNAPKLYDWANEDDAPSMMSDQASPHGISRTPLYDQEKDLD